jgi:hypothetical protein
MIKDIIELQLNDNVKARIIDAKQSNEYQNEDEDDIAVRAQLETYYYFKKLTDAINTENGSDEVLAFINKMKKDKVKKRSIIGAYNDTI